MHTPGLSLVTRSLKDVQRIANAREPGQSMSMELLKPKVANPINAISRDTGRSVAQPLASPLSPQDCHHLPLEITPVKL
jgi:hypothetical protein